MKTTIIRIAAAAVLPAVAFAAFAFQPAQAFADGHDLEFAIEEKDDPTHGGDGPLACVDDLPCPGKDEDEDDDGPSEDVPFACEVGEPGCPGDDADDGGAGGEGGLPKDGLCKIHPDGPGVGLPDPDCEDDRACWVVAYPNEFVPMELWNCPEEDMGEPECIREAIGDCEDEPVDIPEEEECREPVVLIPGLEPCEDEDVPGDDIPQDEPGDDVPLDEPVDEPVDEPQDEPADEPQDEPAVSDDPVTEDRPTVVPAAPETGIGTAISGESVQMSPIYAAIALAIAGGVLGGAALGMRRN